MTTNEFKEYVKTRQALDTEEIHRFMDKMSNEARRITFRLNTAYNGIRAYCHLRSADYDDGYRRTARHRRHCRQLICHHR